MARTLSNCNTHHIFYPRNEWKQRKNAKQLRDYWYCKITLPLDAHGAIHHKLRNIPFPQENVAKRVLTSLREYQRYGAITADDSAENRIMLIIRLIGGSAPETTKALKDELHLIQNART